LRETSPAQPNSRSNKKTEIIKISRKRLVN
jgi:hypothetical protein